MISKHINKYLLAGSVCCTMAMGLTSCDDLFEPALENNLEISQMYTDPTFARGLLDNAYLLLSYERDPWSDGATDDAMINNSGDNYRQMATGSWSATMNPVSQWNRYHAIQYCNLMLENCEKVQWAYSSEALNKMYQDNYRGNAYALRGLHMYYLLRAHAGMVDGQLMGVPIHLVSEDPSSDFNLPRNTFKECVDRIMADLDEALKYLPQQYGDVAAGNVPAKYVSIGADDAQYNRAFGNQHRGKIDGTIIAALKAQVALFAASPAFASAGAMTYDEAARLAAASLKNCGGISGMAANGWKWYADVTAIESMGATDPNPAELVWRSNIADDSGLESNNYPPSLYGNGRINPTQNLVDAFPMANGYPITETAAGYDAANPYANRDPRLLTYILVNGETQGAIGAAINTAADSPTLDGLNHENGRSTVTGYYLRKLLRSDVNLDPSSSTTKKHLPARIRYTEIFLDYAEAANEAQGPKANIGDATFSAYDVIKALRQRAGVGGATDPYLEDCATSKDKMRELIRNERRLELCFENHRFWDLRRWNANLNETATGMSIKTSAAGTLTYTKMDVEARSYSDYMKYGPIPYSEILKFSNLRQNEGWK